MTNRHDGLILSNELKMRNISRTEFAEKMQISRGTVYSYFGTMALSASVKNKIYDVFGFDINTVSMPHDDDLLTCKRALNSALETIEHLKENEKFLQSLINDYRNNE